MPKPFSLQIDESFFQPGQRVAVAVSGGADSVALLRGLLARQEAVGLVLSVIHVHHGIRGVAADKDLAFVEALAARHSLLAHITKVDTPARAAHHGETIEEAARSLRYAYFIELLLAGQADVVVTAHTLDDQAETVLHKFLRGAWTEGLGGISPTVVEKAGTIVRPLLGVARSEVEAYLHALDQPWCEDETNRDQAYTRNRLRHHLLPILAEYNPQLPTQLSRLATIARDEEAFWHAEVNRVGQNLLLPGKPVRGGGRSTSTHPGEASAALELERLRTLNPALRRRVLRWAADKVGVNLDFVHTEWLMRMCQGSDAPRRTDLPNGAFAQRTARELQLMRRQA